MHARTRMDGHALQLLAWCAAFWAALLAFAAREPRRPERARFALGLALGAAACHLAWALLQLPGLLEEPGVPAALLDPTAGYSVLGLPLGLLAVSPRSGRDAWTGTALGTLPPAVAIARLGCLAAGCCTGAAHPTPVYEIAAFVALALAARRLPAAWIAPAVLLGFGGVRLALEPLRAAPAAGEAWLSPSALAGFWMALGAVTGRRAARRPRAACTTTPTR